MNNIEILINHLWSWSLSLYLVYTRYDKKKFKSLLVFEN